MHDASLLAPTERDNIGLAFAEIALEAGRAILDVRARGIVARAKADNSPVTDADLRAEEIILQRLSALLPRMPVVAEEAASRGALPTLGETFILVDALDGTREFIAGRDEFTVNIALIEGRAPIAAALFAPATRQLWFAGARAFACHGEADSAALRSRARKIATRRAAPKRLVALASRSHPDAGTAAFLNNLGVHETRQLGSSIKFGLLAQGDADVYPRFGPTMEWDIAAGDAILRAAGGDTLGEDIQPLTYGHAERGYRNGPFVAWGKHDAATLR